MAYLKEKDAADLLQMHPRTLRRKAKASVIPVTFTAIPFRNGCRYQYLSNDITKYLSANSNKLKP